MNDVELRVQTESAPLLRPPEKVRPLAERDAAEAVPLASDTAGAVDSQVDRFIEALLTEDVHSESFKSRLDAAFRLGREEISVASGLMSGRFMERNMLGMEESPAFRAIEQMRRHLDELNPGRQGDLLAQRKLLGLIPFGNRLKTYFRRFQTAGAQLQDALRQIYAARDDMERDGIELEAVRTQLWEAMQKLKAAIRFAQQTDLRLSHKVAALKASDAQRAKALEQEVQFYARQNLQDMLTQNAVCVNGYLALDVLKKTSREMVIGCERVATTGMSALAAAQTLARATGNQIKVMNMLAGVNEAVESLIVESSKQLGTHAERSAQFGSNPLLGLEKLKEMFDLTFKAMDTIDEFRSKAIEVMGQNNAALQEQLQRAQAYVDKVRREQARAVAMPGVEGPVKL
jgi:uncharacterized protein YaaN involved in tellurite resistance